MDHRELLNRQWHLLPVYTLFLFANLIQWSSQLTYATELSSDKLMLAKLEILEFISDESLKQEKNKQQKNADQKFFSPPVVYKRYQPDSKNLPVNYQEILDTKIEVYTFISDEDLIREFQEKAKLLKEANKKNIMPVTKPVQRAKKSISKKQQQSDKAVTQKPVLRVPPVAVKKVKPAVKEKTQIKPKPIVKALKQVKPKPVVKKVESIIKKKVERKKQIKQKKPSATSAKIVKKQPKKSVNSKSKAKKTIRARRTGKYPKLRRSIDKEMQKKLRMIIRNIGYHKVVKKKKLAIVVVDVTDVYHPKMAVVNGDLMIYAASLPKIAILLGAFDKIDKGKLKYTKSLKNQMIKMIRVSSNYAATHVMDKVGAAYIANLLQSKRYKFYDRKYNGGLWMGKAYGKRPVWKRDPLHNLSHGATVIQIARYYYFLETGRLVSPKRSRQMKAIMVNPGTNHKFVKSLNKYRPGSKIYRKSGTYKGYHADSVLVERNNKTYIAAALAKSYSGGKWLERVIVHIDDMIFNR